MKLTLRFVQDKETPGTVRYAEQDPDGVDHVPTIYIKKSTFPSKKYPQYLTVTIETED
jgi:hypothetical protein